MPNDKLQQQIDGWFKDADTWVGVFENHDLGHRDAGLRCAFPFSRSDGSMQKAVVGQTRAPDGKIIGLGWRYILVDIAVNSEQAYNSLTKHEK